MDISNATEGPFIVLPFGPVSPHRISAAKGQNKVKKLAATLRYRSTERVDGSR
jgi:hypothetical protein